MHDMNTRPTIVYKAGQKERATAKCVYDIRFPAGTNVRTGDVLVRIFAGYMCPCMFIALYGIHFMY